MRIRLGFLPSIVSGTIQLQGLQRCWFEPATACVQISHLVEQLLQVFKIKHVAANICLIVDGFALPHAAPMSLLREGDFIEVVDLQTWTANLQSQQLASASGSLPLLGVPDDCRQLVVHSKGPLSGVHVHGPPGRSPAQPTADGYQVSKSQQLQIAATPPVPQHGMQDTSSDDSHPQQADTSGSPAAGAVPATTQKQGSRSARRKSAKRRLRRQGVLPYSKTKTADKDDGRAGTSQAGTGQKRLRWEQEGQTPAAAGPQQKVLSQGHVHFASSGEEEQRAGKRARSEATPSAPQNGAGASSSRQHAALSAPARKAPATATVSGGSGPNGSRTVAPPAPAAAGLSSKAMAAAVAAVQSSDEESSEDTSSSEESSSAEESSSSEESSSAEQSSSSESSEEESSKASSSSEEEEEEAPNQEKAAAQAQAKPAQAQQQGAAARTQPAAAVPSVPTDPDALPALVGLPQEGDVLAYRLLEIGLNLSPQVSEFRYGRVVAVDGAAAQVSLAPWPDTGRHPLQAVMEALPSQAMEVDDHDNAGPLELPFGTSYQEDGMLHTDMSSFVQCRLLHPSPARAAHTTAPAANSTPAPESSGQVPNARMSLTADGAVAAPHVPPVAAVRTSSSQPVVGAPPSAPVSALQTPPGRTSGGRLPAHPAGHPPARQEQPTPAVAASAPSSAAPAAAPAVALSPSTGPPSRRLPGLPPHPSITTPGSTTGSREVPLTSAAWAGVAQQLQARRQQLMQQQGAIQSPAPITSPQLQPAAPAREAPPVGAALQQGPGRAAAAEAATTQQARHLHVSSPAAVPAAESQSGSQPAAGVNKRPMQGANGVHGSRTAAQVTAHPPALANGSGSDTTPQQNGGTPGAVDNAEMGHAQGRTTMHTPGAVKPRGGARRMMMGPLLNSLRESGHL